MECTCCVQLGENEYNYLPNFDVGIPVDYSETTDSDFRAVYCFLQATATESAAEVAVSKTFASERNDCKQATET